jgi:hypothetical protein
MNKPLTLLPAVVLFCLFSSAPAFAADEEMVDNPAYKSWTKFKPGSAVTMNMNTKMTAMEMKAEMIHKLVSLDKDKAVVETTMKVDIPGAPTPPAQKQDILAKVKKSEATAGQLPPGTKGTVKEKGTETIEISGKKYKCKVLEFEGEAQGSKSTGKMWQTEEIPNLMAKMESNVSAGGQEIKSTLTVTKIESK